MPISDYVTQGWTHLVDGPTRVVRVSQSFIKSGLGGPILLSLANPGDGSNGFLCECREIRILGESWTACSVRELDGDDSCEAKVAVRSVCVMTNGAILYR